VSLAVERLKTLSQRNDFWLPDANWVLQAIDPEAAKKAGATLP
jgi:hypothetical protein